MTALAAGDLIIVPGWRASPAIAGTGPLTDVSLEALAAHHANGGTVASVCSGADALGGAGLLGGPPVRDGPAKAARVAREMIVYARRNGDEQQASAMLRHRNHLSDTAHRAQDHTEAPACSAYAPATKGSRELSLGEGPSRVLLGSGRLREDLSGLEVVAVTPSAPAGCR